MSNIKKLIYLLTSHERKRALQVLIMCLAMALIDTIGIASIMPFMAVLTNPDIVETNTILNFFFKKSEIFGVKNKKDFLFFLGISVFLLLLFSIFFKALTNYVQVHFIQMRNYSISRRLVEGYLHQPYTWFLNRHSADIGKNILSEVANVAGGGINPMMDLVAYLFVTITIFTLLIIIDPILSLSIGAIFGISYGLIYKFTKTLLNRIGKERLNANQIRFTSVSEAFNATKEIKLGNLEEIFTKEFSKSAKIFADRQIWANFIIALPRFGLEAVAFGGMLLMVLYLMVTSTTFDKIVPIIALYAFAGYRLMPAIQQIYNSFAQLSYMGPAVDSLYDDLKNLKKFQKIKVNSALPLNQEIILKNIYYNYPDTSRTALKNINLTILANSTVGLVGTTGSGKTTMVDIILGLLEAQQGKLVIDGQELNKDNLRSWQKSIGYVPQQIYLADKSIKANIAFGIDEKNIDYESVIRAAKIANLHDFVTEELPSRYETKIGEKGVKLSGGQRQRIGIARALYNKPKVLIFDEATSALDNNTEKTVMDSVYKLNKEITIIIIAHRLNTVKKCDNIFLLENGELKGQGKFNQLNKDNMSFKKNYIEEI